MPGKTPKAYIISAGISLAVWLLFSLAGFLANEIWFVLAGLIYLFLAILIFKGELERNRSIQCCESQLLVMNYRGKAIKTIPYEKIGVVAITNFRVRIRHEIADYVESERINKRIILRKITVVSLFQSDSIVPFIDARKTTRKLLWRQKGNHLFTSVCLMDYLEDLLSHTKPGIPVCISQEAYERQKTDYDRIFAKSNVRVYLITAPNKFKQLVFH